jgi:hypothetical protein
MTDTTQAVAEVREELEYTLEREPWRTVEHVPAFAALDTLVARIAELEGLLAQVEPVLLPNFALGEGLREKFALGKSDAHDLVYAIRAALHPHPQETE